eukprot:s2036_g1.t1
MVVQAPCPYQRALPQAAARAGAVQQRPFQACSAPPTRAVSPDRGGSGLAHPTGRASLDAIQMPCEQALTPSNLLQARPVSAEALTQQHQQQHQQHQQRHTIASSRSPDLRPGAAPRGNSRLGAVAEEETGAPKPRPTP